MMKEKLAVLSFDDGTVHDRQLVALLNECGVRATFNLNSGHLGRTDTITQGGRVMDHSHVAPEEVASLYRGHEIAVHTRTHPSLPRLSDAEIVAQVEDDRRALEALCGYPVRAMAYPGGGENSDERVARVIRENTPIRCARAYLPTFGFDVPEDALLWHPTCHLREARVPELIDAFAARREGGVLFLWAHAYNLHYENLWDSLRDTIRRIRESGTPIVTMSEAAAEFTK